jgi:hypothetical protein
MNELEHIHRDWLGMAQPEGLVVTASSLAQAGANLTWPVSELQEQIKALCGDPKKPLDLRVFLRDVLGWSDDSILEGEQLPDNLRFKIEGGEVLSPRLAVKSSEGDSIVLLVGQTEAHGESLDRSSHLNDRIGSASQRFERLVRETGVSVGLLTNGRVFRLIYWPKGESPGSITFELDNLLKADGRPLLGAFHMLLCETRLLVGEPEHRLTGLLKASREYQNTVSEKLRLQVLNALRELLTGFQDADRIAATPLLAEYLGEDARRKDLYAGLVTVLMRMVFVLYAEEKKLLPIDSELYADGYSLTQLYSQLVQDRDRHGEDALDGRFGAWARVITLFRALHNGVLAFHDQVDSGKVVTKKCEIPARRGSFFNPDRFPFIEGRSRAGGRQVGESLDLPRVSDGVVFRILEDLLILGGERLQYKGLDVEQIGSVYEGLMGFDVEFAEGDSICLGKDQVVVDLDVLLEKHGKDRVPFLKETTGLDLKGKAAEAIKAAATSQKIHEALAKRTSQSQEGIIPKGRLFLQPGEERRRTGSHYTPRKLTAPIVETTLRPILASLGPDVKPEQILALKICDPAMGSGAFLVEACRQIADHLVAAWGRSDTTPAIPPDEDVTLHARRLVAQRCLYGVDRNPLAVDLARLSMWLVTFAKLHPFTFVDHSLRHGDSLVGLTREQIASFSIDTSSSSQVTLVRPFAEKSVREVEGLRRRIHAIGDPPDTAELTELWRDAQEKLHDVRLIGDLIVTSFFSETTAKARRRKLDDLGQQVSTWLQVGDHDAALRGLVEDLREGERGVPPFHWEIEFPEVFTRENPGFDAFVGNPPFLGGKRVSALLGSTNNDWLVSDDEESSKNADLCAHFLRNCFRRLRVNGTLGFITTNTIAQGDSRASGLGWVRKNGGSIFAVHRRLVWPGKAAVVVSLIHVRRGPSSSVVLDGREVAQITSYLFDRGPDARPALLAANMNLAFQGVVPLSLGFIFDDEKEAANPLSELERIRIEAPECMERIFPYIGGEEVNDSPTQAPRRWIIDFEEMHEAEASKWGPLFALIKAKVKPERDKKDARKYPRMVNEWWKFWNSRPELRQAIAPLKRVLVIARLSKSGAFVFLPRGMIFSDQLVVFAVEDYETFGVLQSQVHDVWARFFSSSFKDDLRYTPTECFETFPFPVWRDETRERVRSAGCELHSLRARILILRNIGITELCNLVHDEDEDSADIAHLRSLHRQLDAAVFSAYDWGEPPVYGFHAAFGDADEFSEPGADESNVSRRYRWTEEVRLDVLVRLLEVNVERSSLPELRPIATTNRPVTQQTSNETLPLFAARRTI